MLQVPQLVYGSDIGPGRSDEVYSPTSPLDILLHNEISDSSSEDHSTHHQQPAIPRYVELGVLVSASMFTGKRKRDALSAKSQSLDSFF